jgi:hypothetical protein
MNRADLRFSGGRRLTDAQVIKVRKLGGFGPKRGRDGSVKRYVTSMQDEKGKEKIVVANYENKVKPKLNQNNKEHQKFMEDLMELESSGRHPRVKPSEAKRAKKRLKDYVDTGRPVQGVHV